MLAVAKVICITFALSAAMSPVALGQTFQSLFSFNGTDGTFPHGGLIQGRDGNFYGTTELGGADHLGTVYRVTPQGKLTTLQNLNRPEGCFPFAGLVQGSNGVLYDATPAGGANNGGTVFEITSAGKLTTLYSFNGYGSYAGLVLAADGNFYGTTYKDGTNAAGTVFKITPAGKLTTLYNFCSLPKCADGAFPVAALVQGVDGSFYGTTLGDGCNSSCGTVYTMTPAGKLTTLYNFCAQTGCADGSAPLGGLVQGNDGNYYGTTSQGGTNGLGTVYTITPQGKLTTLHRFNGTDGKSPEGTLVLGTDANFYGTTANGGTGGQCIPSCGTVFSITPAGALTTLHSFANGTDGDTPDAGLVQRTDGTFYGTTRYGGVGNGSIYSLSTGLGPFIAFVNRSGKVGSKAEILGQGFKSATAVSFNGTAAQFVVVTDTYLTATVPNGSTTGFVTVTTFRGDMKSNIEFIVVQ